MGWSLPKTLGRLNWLARPLMWVDHLSVARCCAFIAEHNLAEAAALMGAGLHLLHRDLILESIWVELEKKDRYRWFDIAFVRLGMFQLVKT